MYRSFVSLGRYTLKYFILFVAVVNGIVYLSSALYLYRLTCSRSLCKCIHIVCNLFMLVSFAQHNATLLQVLTVYPFLLLSIIFIVWMCHGCSCFCLLEDIWLSQFGVIMNKWSCYDFPCGSAGKKSACNAGNPGSIPGLGRSAGEGIGYTLQYSWASLVATLLKNLPAMWDTRVQSLGWEDPLEKGKATRSSILAWRIP